MKKEAMMALRTFDKDNSADLHWHDRLPNGLAHLIPAVVATALMLIMIGSTILGARWLASGGNLDQTGNVGVIADHQKPGPVPAGRLV